jgi:perosamine synthetase
VIPLYKPHIPPDAARALAAVFQSGQIAGDGNLPDFERQLRDFIGAPFIAPTAEFSRSIEMALRMAGVGPGDSVLLSPLACLASTTPLLQVGAQAIWCDIDLSTGAIRADEIRRWCRPDTKAVLLYHWVGIPGDLEGVQREAAALGLKVIEDAGEALGAEYAGRRIGAHGSDYTVFSFSPVRPITTGEGAAIVFHDEAEYERGRAWRRYGIPSTGFRDTLGEISSACDITVPGSHNYMSRLAGALGSLQMASLPGIVEACRANGAFYDAALDGVAGVQRLTQGVGTVPSYWVYCLLAENRDALLRKLRERGVYASMVHLRNDAYSCFGGRPGDVPAVEDFARRQICIPSGWWVTAEDREIIAETIRSGW